MNQIPCKGCENATAVVDTGLAYRRPTCAW